jgi:hypothetical protein
MLPSQRLLLSSLTRLSTAAAQYSSSGGAAALQCLDQQPTQQQQQHPYQASPPSTMWSAQRGVPRGAAGSGVRGIGGATTTGLRAHAPNHHHHHQAPYYHHHPHFRSVATAATRSSAGPLFPLQASSPPPLWALSPAASPTGRSAAARFATFATDPTISGTAAQQPIQTSPPLPAGARLYLRPTGTGSCEHIGEKLPLPPPIPLAEGTVYEVGRAEPSDIVLRIPTVSTRHALLRVDGGGRVSVTDLNSTNGTAVNGVELSAADGATAEVPLGGEVVFGDAYLARFQLEAVVAPEAGGAAREPSSGSGP